MKTKSLISIAIFLAIFSLVAEAQTPKRPVAKPAATKSQPAADPKPTPAPKASTPEQAFFNEGLKCAKEDYDCQVSNYSKAINLGLNTKEVFKNRGNAFLSRKDAEKAIADFTKLIELDPNDISAYKNRGSLYLEISRTSQAAMAAIRDYTTAIDLEPKDIDLYLRRSRAFIIVRNFEKASVDLEKADTITAGNPNVQIIRGEMLLAQNEFDTAIEAFSKAISLNPDYEKYVLRGNAYASRKKYGLASADFTKAIQLDPSKAHGYLGRGIIAEANKQFDEALRDYNKAIELDKNLGKAFERRAKIYYEKKEYGLAIEDASKSISLQPSHDALLVRMMSHYYRNGNKADEQYNSDLAQWKIVAMRTANKEIAENPRNIDALKLRANVNRSSIQYQLAVDDLKKAIEIEPSNAELRYELAGIYLALNNITSNIYAQNELDKAIELEPAKAEYYGLRADAYSRYNPSYVDDRSIKDYSKAIELDPKNALYYLSRGSLYLRRTYPKSYIEALQDFDRITELSSELKSYAEQQQISIVTNATDGMDSDWLKIQERFLNKKIESSPQNVHYYILRAKYLEKFWDLRDPNSSFAQAMNMKKYWVMARDNVFTQATEDYRKCSEINVEKKQYCMDAAANFKRKVDASTPRK